MMSYLSLAVAVASMLPLVFPALCKLHVILIKAIRPLPARRRAGFAPCRAGGPMLRL
jgi:hypothetical protein